MCALSRLLGLRVVFFLLFFLWVLNTCYGSGGAGQCVAGLLVILIGVRSVAETGSTPRPGPGLGPNPRA